MSPVSHRIIHAFATSGNFLLLLIILGLVGTLSSSSGRPIQKQERTIKKVSWRNEPVKIAKLKIKGKPIGLGQSFLEEDDWLEGMTISVKNTSGKTITFLSMRLDFPRPESSSQEPVSIYEFEYGRNPLFASGSSLPNTPTIAPGESTEFSISDTIYAALKKLLSDYPASIKKVEIVLNSVAFDDGTEWQGGGLYRRDPSDPGRLRRVEAPVGKAAGVFTNGRRRPLANAQRLFSGRNPPRGGDYWFLKAA
jgi:hypothetical protein